MVGLRPASSGTIWREARRGSLLSPVRRFFSNAVSSSLLRAAHKRNAPARMLLGALVGVVWLTFGAAAAFDEVSRAFGQSTQVAQERQVENARTPVRIFADAVCVLRIGKECDFGSITDERVFIARTALAFLTLFTLIFGFWTQLLGAAARAFRALGEGHVVVTGDGWEAEALARSAARKQAVVLVRPSLTSAEQDALAADGVDLLAGPPTDRAVVRAAGVGKADRIVAVGSSDAQNLGVASAVQAERRNTAPGDVLIRIGSAELRQLLPTTARLRAADMFSLSQVSARLLTLTPDMLEEAERRGHDRVHVGVIGWGDASSAVVARLLRQNWALGFEAPSITVFTENASACHADFDRRYPAARSETAWKADVAFVEFNWADHYEPWRAIDALVRERPPLTALVVSLADENDVLHCAAALVSRALTDRIPLYVRESRDGTIAVALASEAGPLVAPYGGPNEVLSAKALIDRSLDRAAQRLHMSYIETCVLAQHRDRYEKALRTAGAPATASIDDLEQRYAERFGAHRLAALRSRLARRMLWRGEFAPDPARPAQRPWGHLPETYISGNRTGADHAVIKLWSLGWRPARAGERGELPKITPDQIDMRICDVEHRRWIADMIMSGWRLGERDDRALRHPDLRPYSEFAGPHREDAVKKDRDPWLAAPMIAAEIFPQLFVRR